MSHEFKTGQTESVDKIYIVRELGLIPAEREGVFHLPKKGEDIKNVTEDNLLDKPHSEHLLSYFEAIPVMDADPICRPTGDATFFTSAGIQKIETLMRQEGELRKQQFKVLQPCIRSQYMDRACEGTSTSFIDFAVGSLRASPHEYSEIAKELISFLIKEGAEPSDLRFEVDSGHDFWGTKKIVKTTLTITVKGVEVGEVVYIPDYPVSEKESIPIIDACVGVERFEWVLGKSANYFPDFDEVYKEGDKIQSTPDQIAAIIDCVRTSVLLAGEGVKPAHKDPGYRLRQLIKRYMERNKGIRLDMRRLIHIADAYWRKWGYCPTIPVEGIISNIMSEHDRSYNVWLVKSVKDQGGPNIQVDVNLPTETFLAKIKATFPQDLQGKIFAIINSIT